MGQQTNTDKLIKIIIYNIIIMYNNKISIGTDCSGIEAPIEALKQLNVSFIHKFSCEKDKECVKSMRANYNPKIIYNDITKRDHKKLSNIDMYVCGFPCQPFSNAGLKMGSKDIRSNIMLECIETIKETKPKVFILENVKNFKSMENGKIFEYLINKLNNLKIYNIYWKIMNTKDYGIPQNRERIYIIGIQRDKDKGFKFPIILKKKPNLTKFLDLKLQNKDTNCVRIHLAIKKIKDIKYNKSKDIFIITPVGFKGSFNMNKCPTLTTNSGYYIYSQKIKRFLHSREALNLQGFSKGFKQVVTNTELFKQVGNSMSVNVLKEIYKEIFKVIR